MPALEDKIATYPASTPDWQIAADLNTPNAINGLADVALLTNEARRTLVVSGAWTAMDQALEANGTAAGVVTAIRNVQDILTLTDPLGAADVATLSGHLATLVTAQLVSSGTKTAIEGQAKRPRSWAEANGVEVTARTVGLARGGR